LKGVQQIQRMIQDLKRTLQSYLFYVHFQYIPVVDDDVAPDSLGVVVVEEAVPDAVDVELKYYSCCFVDH